MNQIGCNHCCIITLQAVISVSWKVNVENLNDPFHKLWITLEKSAKIQSRYCTCMADMDETCYHVAAAMFGVEAAVFTGLTNPSCISSAN